MRADIEKGAEGSVLRLIPISRTEETLLNTWIADKTQNSRQVKDIVLINSYNVPDLPPAVIPEDKPTPEEVLSKKEERDNIKKELDVLNIDYDKRRSTPALRGILEQAKIAKNANEPVEKKPTETIPPAPEPPVEEPPVENEAIPSRELVEEVLTKYAATQGVTAARKLLADHDATKLSELKVEIYPAFLIAAENVKGA